MGAITGRDIRRQLKADLIGKDSHRGITLTYAWMANQFGHFSLGFIPTFFAYRMLLRWYSPAVAATWAPVAVAAGWLLFETYNFLGPLLIKRQSRSKLVFVPGKRKRRFEPAWANVAFDTATDLLFFWMGAFAASIACCFTPAALVTLLVLLGLVLYPVRYWFLTKMYLQAAQYPLQLRLSQWEKEIDDYEMDRVEAFVAGRTSGLHLLVFGPRDTGKTGLAVAMATELSIKHCTCYYTTAIKLYCLFYEKTHHYQPGHLWNWRSASVLVIDDVNPGDPISDELVNPDTFLKFLNTGTTNPANTQCLAEKSVVWVLGNESSTAIDAVTWRGMLENIGVDPNKILTINLQQNGS